MDIFWSPSVEPLHCREGGPVWLGVDMGDGQVTTLMFECRPDGTVVVVDEVHAKAANDG